MQPLTVSDVVEVVLFCLRSVKGCMHKSRKLAYTTANNKPKMRGPQYLLCRPLRLTILTLRVNLTPLLAYTLGIPHLKHKHSAPNNRPVRGVNDFPVRRCYPLPLLPSHPLGNRTGSKNTTYNPNCSGI